MDERNRKPVKRHLKHILLPLLGVLAVALLSLTVLWSTWSYPAINGTVSTLETDSLSERTRQWLLDYAAGLGSWRVPPSYQILDMTIDSTEELGGNAVQIDYHFRSRLKAGRYDNVYFRAYQESDYTYSGQLVVVWIQDAGSWSIGYTMAPAEWQLNHLEEDDEPETVHYSAETYDGLPYRIQDETLSVTYDGETYVEVPDGYERVCSQLDGSYLEVLHPNSYLVTDELTAFLFYDDRIPSDSGISEEDLEYYRSADFRCAVLYFSRDQGQTWEESPIGYGYRAVDYLSLTAEGTVYAAFAADRGLGSDYYVIYSASSSDLEYWEQVNISYLPSSPTCIYWPEDGTGYFSCSTVEQVITGEDGSSHTETTNNNFCVTFDNGATVQTLSYPVDEAYLLSDGTNPYDTLERMYDADGMRYMVIGQGDDADIGSDGQTAKLLYQSADGENFTFVKLLFEGNELAG